MYKFTIDQLTEINNKLENIYFDLNHINQNLQQNVLNDENEIYPECDIEEYMSMFLIIKSILKNMETNQKLLNKIITDK